MGRKRRRKKNMGFAEYRPSMIREKKAFAVPDSRNEHYK